MIYRPVEARLMATPLAALPLPAEQLVRDALLALVPILRSIDSVIATATKSEPMSPTWRTREQLANQIITLTKQGVPSSGEWQVDGGERASFGDRAASAVGRAMAARSR